MIPRLKLVALGLVVWLVAGASGPAPGHAAGPPEIVFSNGGRILGMSADGSERTVIFGKNRAPRNDRRGAQEPDVSPDGGSIVFGFNRGTGSDERNDVWTSGIDGSGSKRLLESRGRLWYADPSFTPDGRIVVSYLDLRKRPGSFGVLSMAADGSDRKTIFKRRQAGRNPDARRVPLEPAVSPDGKRMLYLDGWSYSDGMIEQYFGSPLMVLELKSGKRRKLADEAYSAAWSPDGSRVAFGSVIHAGEEDEFEDACWWVGSCQAGSRLSVINADGSGRRDLTRPTFDARDPDWSSNGRIAFQSTGGLGFFGEGNEIYSLRPDGGCLTQLTNGSPASVSPSWVTGTPGPVKCGAVPPGPELELATPSPDRMQHQSWWLGERVDNTILSLAVAGPGSSSYYYLDCVKRTAANCAGMSIVFSMDVCQLRGQIAGGFGGRGAIRRQRGLPVFRFDDREWGPQVLLIAGRSVVYVLAGSGKGATQAVSQIDELRKLGEEEAGGDLPTAVLPAFDLRLMAKVRKAYESAASVPLAARRLGMSGTRVRENLKLNRSIGQFGEYETVNCPRPGS